MRWPLITLFQCILWFGRCGNISVLFAIFVSLPVCTSFLIWATTRENRSFVFPTRFDTNRPVQSKKLEAWNFGLKNNSTARIATAQLICVIVFASVNPVFS